MVLDVTGTMSSVVDAIHASLKNLYTLLISKRYAQDPQIMFMAIGDSSIAYGRMCDEVPLQVGEYESDIRAALQLEQMVIERGGGGQKMESYQNAAYFLAEYTVHDAWVRRQKKGYVFFIGDEMAWPKVEPDEVLALMSDVLPARSRRRRRSRGCRSGTRRSSSSRTARTTAATVRCLATGASCWARTSCNWPSRTAPPS